MSTDRLIVIISSLGLHERIFKVLSSWLEPRDAYVVVDNERSHHFVLKDMVFQGTVLGPPLWNLFVASCRHAVNVHLFTEVVFADDLNSYRKYHSDANHASIFRDLKKCQKSVHEWGKRHQVEFESTKESLHVLCSKQPRGDAFRILGIKFDTKLSMYDAVVSIVGETGSRLKMIHRVRPFYNVSALINLYKCHVLSFIESGTPAYYHATSSILKLVDEIQIEFLASLGISKETALNDFNLGPLGLRRDIMMLGVLHKIVLGIAPTPVRNLIKPSTRILLSYGFHNGKTFHDKQLNDSVGNNSPVLLKRSIFGLVHVYNRLHQSVVDANTVQTFQRRLMCIARSEMAINPKWDLMFHRQ